MTIPAAKNDCPVTLPFCGLLGEEAEEALGEDQQPEDREHDARHAGDHLDRRLDRAREPGGAPVLRQPRREGDARGGGDRDPDRGHDERADRSDRGSPRLWSWCSEGEGESTNRLGRR